MKNKTVTIDPVLLIFDVTIIIGLLIGFILALNIPIYSLAQYYIGGFGVSAIAWIFVSMHFERLQRFHWFFQYAFTGLGIGVVISGFIVINFL